MANKNVVQEMIKRYNSGEIELSEREKEMLAMQASQMGLDFQVESKPLRKGLFDLVDTAAFGMVPNEWRPRSAGQDIYGETGADKFAGGVGSALGLLGGAGAAVKGAQALKGSMTGGKLATAVSNAKKTAAAKRARDLANNVYNGGKNIVDKGLDQLNPMRDVSFKNLNLGL